MKNMMQMVTQKNVPNSGIGVVIITFNRVEKLKIALKSFEEQTYKPDYVVVVNNASTDNTEQVLSEWQQKKADYIKYIITTKQNLGGSGGFYTGLEFAQKQNSNWIWVSDDDAFPEEDALECAKQYLDMHNAECDNISAICGAVINEGEYAFAHRRKLITTKVKVKNINSSSEDYEKEDFDIDCFSYVGAIINKAKLKQVGLTQRDYFIWYDDTEHSLRLRKVGRIICIPSIKIHHDTGHAKGGSVSWKTYYGIRNCADMIRRHFPKRYYYYFVFVRTIKACINLVIRRHTCYNKIVIRAIKDVCHRKMGLDAVYKPGWKPSQYREND